MKRFTKREYFAALAMQSMVSISYQPPHSLADDVSKTAVEYADALIAELEK